MTDKTATPDFQDALLCWLNSEVDNEHSTEKLRKFLVEQHEIGPDDEMTFIVHNDEGVYVVAENKTTGDVCPYAYLGGM